MRPIFRLFFDVPDGGDGGANVDQPVGGDTPAQETTPPGGDTPAEPAPDWRALYEAQQADIEAGRHPGIHDRAQALLDEIVPRQTAPVPPMPQPQYQPPQERAEPEDETQRLARLEAWAQRQEREHALSAWDDAMGGFRKNYPQMSQAEVEANVEALALRGARHDQINVEALCKLSHEKRQGDLDSYAKSRLTERLQTVRKIADTGDLAAIAALAADAKADPFDRSVAEAVQVAIKGYTDRVRTNAPPTVPAHSAGVPASADGKITTGKGLEAALRGRGFGS